MAERLPQFAKTTMSKPRPNILLITVDQMRFDPLRKSYA